ncbi:MAG: DNA polymerase III subunit beta [Rhodospirillaceae bacterium]|nr:DNA polymerase III subunit beta [Rhodospirillaceae bacterium]
MKLTIERTLLLKALGHVQSVVERRNTIPILSNVLAEAKDGQLALTATDMDLAVVEKVPADIAAPGAATVPAHTLYDIVRKLPDGAQVQIELAADGQQVTVKAGRSRFALATLPKEDFPAIHAGDLPHKFPLSAADLKGLIDRTKFAISTEETRYYLNGIYVHAYAAGKQTSLRAVATDGHRLARVEMPLPEGAESIPGVIVPRKMVNEVRKLIEDFEGSVDVSLSDSRIRFAFADVVLTSKLIDGSFPDYQRVIPTANDKVLEVDRKEFRDAVDRVSTISSEKSRAVKLSLKPGTLTLSATSAENGSASEEIEVKYDGQPMEIGFNSKYLLDVADEIEGQGLELKLADSVAPTLLRDMADAQALYVLMPMRV